MGVSLDEREFHLKADAMLARVEQAIEDAGLDFEIQPGGVIEIEFDDGSKIVVNRHAAAREIWVAARSGGYHFRCDGENWIATRDGAELMSVLGRCVAEQSGGEASLS